VNDVTVMSCWSQYSGNDLPVLAWYRSDESHTQLTSLDRYNVRLAQRDIRVRGMALVTMVTSSHRQ